MNLWKLTLAYDGSRFYGWQVQPHRPTIQGALSAAIEQMAGERVLPQGSGRTDTGVHALGQVASFALESSIPAPNLLRALNRVLPPSIRVLAAESAAPGFHARHSALRKTYEYRIFERKPPHPGGAPASSARALAGSVECDPSGSANLGFSNSPGLAAAKASERICPPFLAPFVWDCRWPLQWDALQKAASLFRGTHDFTSFAASDPDHTQRALSAPVARAPGGPDTATASECSQRRAPNPVKTIAVSTFLRENGLLVYRITGSGFLHHMVRNIVGTLVEVGRGSLRAEAIPGILRARNRSAAGPTAPARGLFLVQVDYGPAGAGDGTLEEQL